MLPHSVCAHSVVLSATCTTCLPLQAAKLAVQQAAQRCIEHSNGMTSLATPVSHAGRQACGAAAGGGAAGGRPGTEAARAGGRRGGAAATGGGALCCDRPLVGRALRFDCGVHRGCSRARRCPVRTACKPISTEWDHLGLQQLRCSCKQIAAVPALRTLHVLSMVVASSRRNQLLLHYPPWSPHRTCSKCVPQHHAWAAHPRQPPPAMRQPPQQRAGRRAGAAAPRHVAPAPGGKPLARRQQTSLKRTRGRKLCSRLLRRQRQQQRRCP